jgi:hypothetical protein
MRDMESAMIQTRPARAMALFAQNQTLGVAMPDVAPETLYQRVQVV